MTALGAPAPYTLTEAGWPRPNVGGYPIPWVTPAENLAEVNEGRRLASVGGGLCQVCGQGFGFDEKAYGFTPMSVVLAASICHDDFLGKILGSSTKVLLLDGAVLHPNCARLTAAMCPHVRDRADLIFVEVPANDADPVTDEDGVLRPSYAAGDVRYIPWPSDRSP